MGTPEEAPTETGRAGPIDELVKELQARVQARRSGGTYPAGLEEEMTAHLRRILHHRTQATPVPDVRGAVQTSARALPLGVDRIPHDSGILGGEVLHKTIARIVGRQTQGIIEQVQGFAQPVQAALEVLATAIEQLTELVQTDVAQSLDSLYERQAAQERTMQAAGYADRRLRPPDFKPWYASEHFEETFRGSREEMHERYRDLAARLVGFAPVLDLGCGRGEFLELLEAEGIESHGVDLDGELVKAAVDHGLRVEETDGLRYLADIENGSLGGLALIQVIEHFSAQEIVDFVALAADKLRPGGRLFVETVNPQSLYVFAHALFLDPTHMRPVHPAYLAFLLREAGFSSVDIEWRSPAPAEDILAPVPGDEPSASLHNENVRRLNELLFAPQDYLIAADR